jgi:hypothetical protein
MALRGAAGLEIPLSMPFACSSPTALQLAGRVIMFLSLSNILSFYISFIILSVHAASKAYLAIYLGLFLFLDLLSTGQFDASLRSTTDLSFLA